MKGCEDMTKPNALEEIKKLEEENSELTSQVNYLKSEIKALKEQKKGLVQALSDEATRYNELETELETHLSRNPEDGVS